MKRGQLWENLAAGAVTHALDGLLLQHKCLRMKVTSFLSV
jgi:hypothetical protein